MTYAVIKTDESDATKRFERWAYSTDCGKAGTGFATEDDAAQAALKAVAATLAAIPTRLDHPFLVVANGLPTRFLTREDAARFQDRLRDEQRIESQVYHEHIVREPVRWSGTPKPTPAQH